MRFSAAFASIAAIATAAVLVACGGGTSANRSFKPDRILAFGDETSLLLSDGRKFTVNALTTTDALDCASNALWVQTVATAFGYVFAECNPNASADVKAFMRAAAAAKVDDLRAQVDAQVARTGDGGGIRAGDLVTVLAGANDILELYGQFPTRNEAELTADARARGERLAAQVNRLVNLGAKVIVSTVPDMGLTPFALTEKANKTDTDRAALLTRLTAAFNGRVRVNILNDGRFLGLVLADEMVQTMAAFPLSYGLANNVAGACTTELPNCTAKTLATDASASGYLWADATRLSYAGHLQLGNLAATRALNNPF